jgi:hypothetical protein
MNTKLGFLVHHLGPEMLDLIGQFRPRVVKAFDFSDPGFWTAARQRSPDSLFLGKIIEITEILDSPVQRAREFCDQMRSTAEALRGVIDAWEGYDGWGGHPDNVKALAEFEVERTRILHGWGLQSAVGGFYPGTPDFAWWDYFYPALAEADYLHLHETSGSRLRLRPGETTLRYRRVYERLPDHLRKPLIVSALRIQGPDGGWPSDMALVEDHVSELLWYDAETQKDDYVAGAVISGIQPSDRSDFYEAMRRGASIIDTSDALTRLLLRKLQRYVTPGDGYALANFQGVSENEPLTVDRCYDLDVSLHGDAQQWFYRRVPDEEWWRNPTGGVNVVVVGQGFDVQPARASHLPVTAGVSTRFQVTPTQEGAGQLSVQFYADDLFLDRIDLSRRTMRVTRARHFEHPRFRRLPIHLSPRGPASYDVQIGVRDGFKIELSRTDVVDDVNRQFIAALDAVRKQTRATPEAKLSPADLEKLAAGLRRASQFAFDETFKRRTPIRDEMERIETESRAKGRGLLIEIQAPSSDSLPLVWESLYDEDVATPPAPENHWGLDEVWGFRHVVARQLFGSAYANLDNYLEDLVNRGGMVLFINDRLSQVVHVEVPQLTGLAQQHRLGHRTWPAKPGLSPQELLDFLGDPQFNYDFVHFACHARTQSGQASAMELELAANKKPLRVTYLDLRTGLRELRSNPLVFLNGCSTGNEPPLQTRNLVSLFLDLGARGVVATECTMPDVFAAPFAAEFYRRFFTRSNGGPPGLGEALLATRRHFLENYNNPLGLAYTLYADGETRVGWEHSSDYD